MQCFPGIGTFQRLKEKKTPPHALIPVTPQSGRGRSKRS